ncbi:MAG: hypothetical protein JST00_23575 [Deltaproteobacteria bacterium]|nr:hypothetical protein [Deltaproteobacteria bacterium]
MSLRHPISFGPLAAALTVAFSLYVFPTSARAEEAEPPAPAPEAPSSSSGTLRRGSVILPDIVGVSTLPLVGAVTLAGPGVVGAVGAVGGIGLSGPVSFGFSSGDGGAKSSHIGLSPSVDVFVTDRLTIGGRVTAARYTSSYVSRTTIPGSTQAISSTSGSEGYVLAFAPRVGYVVPLTDAIAFWPQIGITVGQSRSELDNAGRALSRSLGAEVEAGFVMPIGRHVIVRVAPTLAYGYAWIDATGGGSSEDADTVRAGVRAQIGLAF